MRIVHPAALRNPDYFRTMNPLARPYFLMDSARVAAFHGLPFRRPLPDPIIQISSRLALAAEQPLARWLGRLGIAATSRDAGRPSVLKFPAYYGAAVLMAGTEGTI